MLIDANCKKQIAVQLRPGTVAALPLEPQMSSIGHSCGNRDLQRARCRHHARAAARRTCRRSLNHTSLALTLLSGSNAAAAASNAFVLRDQIETTPRAFDRIAK